MKTMSEMTEVAVEAVQEGSVEDRQALIAEISELRGRQDVLTRDGEFLRSTIRGLNERLEQLAEEQREAVRVKESLQREFDDFKERITVRMHHEADRRDWCGEFDDIMSEFGLRRRSQEYTVVFELSGYFQRTVIARDADHAERLAWNAVRFNTGTYNIAGEEVTIRDIEAEVVE